MTAEYLLQHYRAYDLVGVGSNEGKRMALYPAFIFIPVKDEPDMLYMTTGNWDGIDLFVMIETAVEVTEIDGKPVSERYDQLVDIKGDVVGKLVLHQ